MRKHQHLLFLLTSSLLIMGLVSCGSKGSNPPEPPSPSTNVTGVSISQSSLTLSVDAVYYLSATVEPSSAINQNVTWSSSDNNYVSVNQDGKIIGVAEGSATITVTTEEGSFTDTCQVTVTTDPIPVTGVKLSFNTASIKIGKTITLSPTVEPVTADNQNVSWTSSNQAVASVSSTGVVEGLSVGESTITVTTADGGFTDTCLISVYEDSSSDDEYVPDESDESILFITTDRIAEEIANSKYSTTVQTSYKQIYVNAPDVKVTIDLKNATIENSENSPIYVADCDSIDISAKNGSVNVIKDTRAAYSGDVAGQGKGAIYVANGDLTLKGQGQLDIEAGYYNGVHGKDDVELKNLTLNITAVNHAVRGNDSISVASGTYNFLCGGDGLHTENSDVSSKGNQRGDVSITGGTFTINSWADAVQAAHDSVIENATLTIKTNKYSSYDGVVIEPNDTKLYLKMNSSTYANGAYTYAAYINGEWYRASYKGTISSGGPGRPGTGGPGGGGGGQGGGTYYCYQLDRPVDATSFKLYRFSGSNVAPSSFSTSNYNAVSSVTSFNSYYDMISVGVSGSSISLSGWSTYSSNNNGADISAKGVKAENEIYIKEGTTLDIEAYDDGIHANNDGYLENGSVPLGNVNIQGGNLSIKAADDGIHADNVLNISGGIVNIKESYEGLEGNVINISDGESYVFSSDDGVNASSGKSSPAINVSGGYLDVTVPANGDTDGIDSNGTYTQTGGVVIVKGPGNAGTTNVGSAALDTDSTVRITSGTLIVFGGIEQSPSYSVTRTLCTSNTVSTGSHTVTFNAASTSYTTTLKYSTRGCVVYSSLGSASLS